jgi:hypothetical protein
MFKFIGALVVYGFAAYGVTRFLEERGEAGHGARASDTDKSVSRLKTFEVVK